MNSLARLSWWVFDSIKICMLSKALGKICQNFGFLWPTFFSLGKESWNLRFRLYMGKCWSEKTRIKAYCTQSSCFVFQTFFQHCYVCGYENLSNFIDHKSLGSFYKNNKISYLYFHKYIGNWCNHNQGSCKDHIQMFLVNCLRMYIWRDSLEY